MIYIYRERERYTCIYNIYIYIYVFSQCPACPSAQPIKNKEIRVDNPTMGLRTMLRSFFVSPLQPTQLIKCFHPRYFPIQITAALASRERKKREKAWLQFKRAASVQ